MDRTARIPKAGRFERALLEANAFNEIGLVFRLLLSSGWEEGVLQSVRFIVADDSIVPRLNHNPGHARLRP